MLKSPIHQPLVRLDNNLEKQFQSLVFTKMNANKSILNKKSDSQNRQFYWLPDLSFAGFATKNQIKKNVAMWHDQVCIDI